VTISLQLLAILKTAASPRLECIGAAASLFLVAILYAAASLAVVIVVCPPLGRMTNAAELFLAPLLTSVCSDVIRTFRTPVV
jgi:hypothetical protein